MDTKKIQKELEELAGPLIEAMGLELIEARVLAEGGRTILRLTADREGGITLDDCVRLSRELSPHLEVADIVPYAYNLEVSSPGLRRPLKKPAHFARYAGEMVAVTSSRPIEGRKRFKGKNLGIDENERVLIEIDGQTHRVPLADVAEARLDPELPFAGRAGKNGKSK